MLNQRKLVLAFLLLLVACNAWFIWRRISPSRDELSTTPAIDGILERQRQRTFWEEATTISLKSPDLRRHVANIQEGCLPVPDAGELVRVTELTEQQCSDLYDAIAEFLETYNRNDPRAVVAMMNSRGLDFDPARVTVLREVLGKLPGYNPKSVSDLSSEEVYVALWKVEHYRPSMEAIAVDASCVTIWRTDGRRDVASVQDVDEFTEWVPATWRGMTTFAPNFVRAPNYPSVTDASDSPVDVGFLVADAQLILQNEHVQLEGKSPYLLRLLYDQQAEKWQPMLLAAILLDEVEVATLMF
jgi:hypothetical protein